MKAISLHQPFASAVVLGSKRVETRGWETSHRGPIAIHASKHFTIDGLRRIACSWTWCGVLRFAGVHMAGRNLWDVLPFGAVVGTANLVDCRPTDSFTVAELDTQRLPTGEDGKHYAWTERMLGDYSPGRFGWILSDPVLLIDPIPVRGRQRIFNLPNEVAEAVDRQTREGWRPMRTGPMTGPVVDVEVKTKDGRVVEAHFARDLSGDEQPPFEGWFTRAGSGFTQIDPVAWRPIGSAR